jgi:hypothetical protein
MLKQWIHQIRLNPVHYGTSLWNYHLSGKVIDLYVESAYIRDKKKYRVAVIKIGMVLQAIIKKLDEREIPYLIQSFPNLEDLRIVASIRIDKSGESQNSAATPKKRTEKSPDRDTELDYLVNFASSNQLQLIEIAQPDLPDQHEIPYENVNWFALCSRINNPFTWLKAGYWQEMASSFNTCTESDQKLFIITEFPEKKKIRFLNNDSDNLTIQTLVALQK